MPTEGVVIASWWGPALVYAMLLGVAGTAACVLFGRSWPLSERRMIGFPSLFLVVVPLASLYFENNESMTLVIYQEAAASIAAGSMALHSIWFLWRGGKKPDGSEFDPGARMPGAVIAFFVGYLALHEGVEFYGDVFEPRDVVHGSIDGLQSSYWTRRGTQAAKIEVGGQWLYATTDIEPRLHVGAFVEAEVGAGSGYILSLRKP
jgi:hypothetical protein